MKILIINDNVKVPIENDLINAYNWLVANTGLEYNLKTEFFNISLDFKSYGQFYGTTGTQQKLSPLIKEQYDIVLHMYGCVDDKTPQGQQLDAWNFLEQVNGADYIEIPCSERGYNDKWIGKTVIHEIMHSLCKLANRKGGKVIDVIDTIDAPNGNYNLTLASLKPYLNLLMNKKNVIINRTSDNGFETLGDLTVDNFTCKVLERPYKNNKTNISCIPKGLYNCKWTFSLRFLKYTYEVQNVSGRSGIRIHSGNFFNDTDGCILLGDSYNDLNKDGQVDILNSRITIAKFETLMAKKDFILVIK